MPDDSNAGIPIAKFAALLELLTADDRFNLR